MKGIKKKVSKVILSSTLLLMMVFSIVPTNVFAMENESNIQNIASPKAGDVDINETNFPDANFRNYIQNSRNNINTNGDNVLSTTEIQNATELILFQQGISDLTGIEHLTALTKLECNGNQLTSLDVSNNNSLTRLNCTNNQLTSLKIGPNTSLTELASNNNQLTSLDVSQNTALTNLQCSGNQLTSLDVSNNTSLTMLTCEKNKLASLDVSPLKSLKSLSCENNLLTSLKIGPNTSLTKLTCYTNKLTNLDVSEVVNLTDLECSINQLTTLDVSNNTSLTMLILDGNQLTTLDVSKNKSLDGLVCNDNQLTALDVSNNTSLTMLILDNNKLTNLDVSNNKSLTGLSCLHNQLTSLVVSQNPSLGFLNCSGNQLTSLDVSNNTSLGFFDCSAQTRTITYDNTKGYLLSAYDTGFDKSKASNFVGATYKEGTLAGVAFNKPITYDYDAGCTSSTLNTPMNVTLTFAERKGNPTITAGNNGTNHQISSDKDMTFTCSGNLENLTGVYVDGKLVAENNYTLKSGSTILTLKSSYLDTLSVGKHILKFQYKDNISAETEFTITAKTDATPTNPSSPNTGATPTKPNSPTTGDTSNTMLYLGLMVLSGCLAGYGLKKNKALRR
ncbi:MAG: X2-like carbohydrate binding domain-containing protein [Anaerovoracaceae bacterium]